MLQRGLFRQGARAGAVLRTRTGKLFSVFYGISNVRLFSAVFPRLDAENRASECPSVLEMNTSDPQEEA